MTDQARKRFRMSLTGLDGDMIELARAIELIEESNQLLGREGSSSRPSREQSRHSMLVTCLVELAKTHAAYTFEDHMRVVHCLARRLEQQGMLLRPSVFAGATSAAVDVQELAQRSLVSPETISKTLETALARVCGNRSFSSFLGDLAASWSFRAPWTRLVSNRHGALEQIAKWMITESASQDNLAGSADEWVEVCWAKRGDKEDQACRDLYVVLDSLAAFLTSEHKGLEPVGLPFWLNGRVVQHVKDKVSDASASSRGSWRVAFDYLDEWMRAFSFAPSRAHDATDQAMQIIKDVFSFLEDSCALGDSFCPSPFLEESSMLQVESPIVSADAMLVDWFSREPPAPKCEWPFVTTRRCPAIVWHEGLLVKALIRSSAPLEIARPCIVPPIYFRGWDATVSAANLSREITTMRSHVTAWMFGLFKQERSLAESPEVLFDLEALQSKTHSLWRELCGVSVEDMLLLCEGDDLACETCLIDYMTA